MPYPYPVSHPLSWALSLEGPTSPRGSLRGQESLLCTVAPPSAAAPTTAVASPPPRRVAAAPATRAAPGRWGADSRGGSTPPHVVGVALSGPRGRRPPPPFPFPLPPFGGEGEKCAAQGSTLGGRGGIGEVK